MRLTLRTLLAYLDGVLPSSESDALKAKIEDSPFAKGLVGRIQDVTKRAKLSAPKLNGVGLDGDPNSVAEYFDGHLPPEQIGEFERICLESDSHLAEAVSVHQILTFVNSGQGVAVADSLRKRILDLPKEQRVGSIPSDNGHKERSGHEEHAARQPEKTREAEKENDQREIAAILSKPADQPAPKRQTLWIAIAAMLLCALGASMFVPGIRDAISTALSSKSSGPAPMAGSRDDDDAPSEPNKSANPIDGAASRSTDGGTSSTEEEPSDSSIASSENEEGTVDKAVSSEASKSVGDEPPPPTNNEEADDDGEPITEAPMLSEDSSPKLDIEQVPDLVGASKKRIPIDDNRSDGMEIVGRMQSDAEVVAIIKGEVKDLQRLPARATIRPGDSIFVPPIFRPTIGLSLGAQLNLVGPATFRIDAPSEGEEARVRIEYGKFIVSNLRGRPNKMRLLLGDREGELEFLDNESEAAIEITPYLPPGADPESSDPIKVVSIYAASGSVGWREMGAESREVSESYALTMVTGAETTLDGPFLKPDWIDLEKVVTLDRDASKLVERLLPLDKPLAIPLSELVTHRRIDFRSFAARTFTHLDQSQATLTNLGDPDQRAVLNSQLDSLRFQLALGGAHASSIKKQAEMILGDRGIRVYRMLWGYDEKQLKDGRAAELVQGLDDTSLEVRLLSIENLRRITGSSQKYVAWATNERNRSHVQTWKRLLKDGAIRYSKAPSPLPNWRPMPTERRS